MKSEYARNPWEDANTTDWTFITLIIIAGLSCIPIILANSDYHMPNDEIIAEVKKCKDADLLGQVVFDKHRKNVIKVQCITKIKESVEGPVTSSEA